MEETQSSNKARFLEFLRLKVAFPPFIRSTNLVSGSLVFYPLRVRVTRLRILAIVTAVQPDDVAHLNCRTIGHDRQNTQLNTTLSSLPH